jgi:hypothetical protein
VYPAQPSRRSGNSLFKNAILHCGCVVVLRQAENQHLVCLEAAGALTAAPTRHGR